MIWTLQLSHYLLAHPGNIFYISWLESENHRKVIICGQGIYKTTVSVWVKKNSYHIYWFSSLRRITPTRNDSEHHMTDWNRRFRTRRNELTGQKRRYCVGSKDLQLVLILSLYLRHRQDPLSMRSRRFTSAFPPRWGGFERASWAISLPPSPFSTTKAIVIWRRLT